MSDDDKWRIEGRGGLVCANQYCDAHYKLHNGYVVRKDRTKQHNVGTITLRNKEVLWYAVSEDGGPPMGFEQAVRENDLYQQSSRGVANELYPDVDPNTMLSVEPPLVAWLKSKRLVFSPCILTAMYQMLSFPNEIKFEEDEAVIETVPWGDSILNERAPTPDVPSPVQSSVEGLPEGAFCEDCKQLCSTTDVLTGTWTGSVQYVWDLIYACVSLYGHFGHIAHLITSYVKLSFEHMCHSDVLALFSRLPLVKKFRFEKSACLCLSFSRCAG